MEKGIVMKKKNYGFGLLLTGFFLVFCFNYAFAADYPSRDVTVIVPFGAGGGCDMTARAFLKNAKKYSPVNFNVINVPGGGGVVGLAKAVTARPDGYTLSVIEVNCIQAANIQGMTKYDGATDLLPLSRIGFAEAAICVKNDSQFKTLKDLMEYARENPNKLNVSIGSGKGGCWDMPLQVLNSSENVTMKHVYMHGGAAARTAALGGHVDACAIGIMEAEPFVRSGDLRILAIFGENRNPKLPDVPTVGELGYPEIDMGVSFVLFLPKNLDSAQVEYLTSFAENCFNDPESTETLEKMVIAKPKTFMGSEETIQWMKNNEERVKMVLTNLGMAK